MISAIRSVRAPILLAAILSSCESLTEAPQRQPLGAELSGGAVQPDSVGTTGSGTFTGTLRMLNGAAAMDYSLSFSGLVGNATAVHLHGPATAENTGEILVDLSAPPAGSTGTISVGGTSGSGSGMLDLATAVTPTVSGDSLHALLDAGMVYVDVHTSTRAGGEIRGQIRKR